MNLARFEALVRKAVAALPEEFRQHLDDVVVIVQDAPTPEQASRWELDEDELAEELFGFYDGVPLTERTADDLGTQQDAIYIFRRAHEAGGASEREIIAEITKTVVHEVGHHFGLDDDRIDELGFG